MADEACILAALVGERETRAPTRAVRHARGTSDLLDVLEAFEHVRADRFRHDVVRQTGLDPGAVGAVERVRAQLERIVRSADARPQPGAGEYESALLKTILAG